MSVMDLQDIFVYVNVDIQDLIVKVRYKFNLSLTVKIVKLRRNCINLDK